MVRATHFDVRPGTVLTVLAGYNVAQNVLLTKRGYVPGNLVMTGIGLGWARSSGLTWSEVGLSRRDLAAGLKLGTGIAAGAAALAFLIRDQRWALALIDDETLTELSGREHVLRPLVRYPLGTALFEEVWFRGLLSAALRRHGVRHPGVVSSTAFAAWHLIPTARAISANRAGRTLGREHKAMLVGAGSLAAGIAGLGFDRTRQISSSLAAPWLAHATFNSLGHWVAVRVRRSVRSTQ